MPHERFSDEGRHCAAPPARSAGAVFARNVVDGLRIVLQTARSAPWPWPLTSPWRRHPTSRALAELKLWFEQRDALAFVTGRGAAVGRSDVELKADALPVRAARVAHLRGESGKATGGDAVGVEHLARAEAGTHDELLSGTVDAGGEREIDGGGVEAVGEEAGPDVEAPLSSRDERQLRLPLDVLEASLTRAEHDSLGRAALGLCAAGAQDQREERAGPGSGAALAHESSS